MGRKSKNKQRREKAKQRKQAGRGSVPVRADKEQEEAKVHTEQQQPIEPQHTIDDNIPIEVETVSDREDLPDGISAIYKEVFDKFHALESRENGDDQIEEGETSEKVASKDEEALTSSKGKLMDSDDTSEDENDSGLELQVEDSSAGESKLSKRQFRKKFQIPLAILKAETRHPEYVEWMDADSPDPRLLVYIKTQHNVVPIPEHWTTNRGFLASKKNTMDRPPFELPSFIQSTGILDMRDASGEAEDRLKQRMRERVQPKMGQLDLDFNKLYDAFFKYQTKPELLGYGELYREGMQDTEHINEYRASKYRPGQMSDELQKALGMRTGSEAPPWVGRMKVIGPPPSYPYMRVGEDGIVSFIDEDAKRVKNVGVVEDRGVYGQLEADEEEDEDEDEDEEEDEEGEEEKREREHKHFDTDVMLETYGGEMNEELRKESETKTAELKEPENEGSPKLYTVLKEKMSGEHGSIYGSETLAYEMGSEERKRSNDDRTKEEEPSAKKPKKEGSRGSGKFRF
ncbi:DEKNAAC100665 [Brettanomyces naardenensis]|uniref:DEKNAAC100665 n=1 Tax=Brettanomyces naardenensis TaxID=13370 RepID=A0A448YEM7_BRENA|nr:DEKNAAC100665 [Brettanomyces naardenensis]